MTENNSSTARFRATIEYDGTGFHGSQLQPDVRTVQGELETALSKLLDCAVRVDLSGRTDTGVHAAAQEIAFTSPKPWEATELRRALRAILPDDVGVASVSETDAEFHPRFDATARRYEYLLTQSVDGGVFMRDRAWITAHAGTVDQLTALADRFVGERSFEAFAKAGQPERGTRCRIESATWTQARPDLLRFEIIADRFLHHMVRYIVGTSIEIASGARPASDLEALLENRKASRAVFPAPPAGLYLTGVQYKGVWNRVGGVPWFTRTD